jgi:hypothetical protein
MNTEHSFIQEEKRAVSGCADVPVLCLCAHPEGLVLLGTPSGIACVDAHSFNLKHLAQTPFPVKTIAITNGRVWAAGGSFAAEFSMDGERLLPLQTSRIPLDVLKLHTVGSRTAAVGANRIVFLDEGREELEGPPAVLVSSAVGPDGALFAASESDLWVLRAGGWERITPSNISSLLIRDIDVDSHGHVYAASPHGLLCGFIWICGAHRRFRRASVRRCSLCAHRRRGTAFGHGHWSGGVPLGPLEAVRRKKMAAVGRG